jgi:hypothetical protein
MRIRAGPRVPLTRGGVEVDGVHECLPHIRGLPDVDVHECLPHKRVPSFLSQVVGRRTLRTHLSDGGLAYAPREEIGDRQLEVLLSVV